MRALKNQVKQRQGNEMDARMVQAAARDDVSACLALRWRCVDANMIDFLASDYGHDARD